MIKNIALKAKKASSQLASLGADTKNNIYYEKDQWEWILNY